MNKRNQETIKNKSVGADDSICLKEQQGITLIALAISRKCVRYEERA